MGMHRSFFEKPPGQAPAHKLDSWGASCIEVCLIPGLGPRSVVSTELSARESKKCSGEPSLVEGCTDKWELALVQPSITHRSYHATALLVAQDCRNSKSHIR